MAVPHSSPRSGSSARCARCGCVFDCGKLTRPFDCWCASMPALPGAAAAPQASPHQAGGCLCPACYAEALAASGRVGRAADRPHAPDAGGTGSADDAGAPNDNSTD